MTIKINEYYKIESILETMLMEHGLKMDCFHVELINNGGMDYAG